MKSLKSIIPFVFLLLQGTQSPAERYGPNGQEPDVPGKAVFDEITKEPGKDYWELEFLVMTNKPASLRVAKRSFSKASVGTYLKREGQKLPEFFSGMQYDGGDSLFVFYRSSSPDTLAFLAGRLRKFCEAVSTEPIPDVEFPTPAKIKRVSEWSFPMQEWGEWNNPKQPERFRNK